MLLRKIKTLNLKNVHNTQYHSLTLALKTLANYPKLRRHKNATGESQNEHANLSPIQEEMSPWQQVI